MSAKTDGDRAEAILGDAEGQLAKTRLALNSALDHLRAAQWSLGELRKALGWPKGLRK